MLVAELPQHVEHTLFALLPGALDAREQLVEKRLPIRQHVQTALVQQHVELHGLLAHPFGKPLAARQQVDQQLPRVRVLFEKHQIGGAAQHRTEYRRQPAEHELRVVPVA